MLKMMSKIIPVSAAFSLMLLVGVGSVAASEYSGSLSIGGSVKPDTPKELVAEKTGEQEISINWEEVNGVDGYNLYRFVEQDGEMVKDREFDFGGTTYVDSNLEEGTYSYIVQSYSGDLVSDKSATTSKISIVIEEDNNPDNGDTGDSNNGSDSESNSSSSSSSGGGGGSSPADPPSIENIKVEVSTSTAKITWDTDQDSLTWIQYGETSDYGSEVKTDSYIATHSVILEDLSPDTTYHYQINSENNDDESSDYTDETFDTLSVTQEEDQEGRENTQDESEQKVLGEKVENERDQQLNQIMEDADIVVEGNVSNFVENMGQERDTEKEAKAMKKYINPLVEETGGQTDANTSTMNDFVTYGTPSTFELGAGERAGVVNSYRAAFGELPSTEKEWQDAIKIANGRWPSQRSEKAENRAEETFQDIYKKEPNMDDPHDNAAVTIMAYGLRPDNRNTESEAAAINSFEAIYDKAPQSATDWDTVRAIAYSGASR